MVKLHTFTISDWIRRGYRRRDVNEILSRFLVIAVLCLISTPTITADNNHNTPELRAKATQQQSQDTVPTPLYNASNLQVQLNETKVAPQNQTALTKTGTLAVNDTNLVEDELNTSDTHLNSALSFDTNLDEELEQQQVNENDSSSSSSPDDDEDFSDTHNVAGSQMNEQKVVRELKRIISKGMSSATDKVKLETLENLRAKQEERKLVKETRAKLFEDLLTTAINSHPEKIKTKVKVKDHHKAAADSSSSLLKGNNDDVVSEVGDYETVFHHLSNLVTSMDKNRLPLAEPESIHPQPDEQYSIDDASEFVSNSNGGEKSSKSSSHPEIKVQKKKEFDLNERPLVKKFKKIKKQISQRRKQLDQIKSMFNIDLSLNSKDGSLIGKPTVSKKKRPTTSVDDEQLQEYEPLSTDNVLNLRSEGKFGGGKQQSNGKLQELMNYLRENPEILASVMDELTPSSTSGKKAIVDEDSILNSGSSSAADDLSSLNLFNQDLINSQNNNLKRQQQELASSSTRSRLSHKDLGVNNAQALNTIKHPKWKTHSNGLDDLRPKLFSTNLSSFNIPKPLFSESLLLKSLRERQLMNLARLDMVLASRHNGSNNKSYLFSALNSSSSPLISKLSTTDNTYERGNLITNQQRSNVISKNKQVSGNSTNSSNDEVHHYMVMNPDQREVVSLDKQLNDFSTTHNQYPQQTSTSSDMNTISRYNHRAQQLPQEPSPEVLSRFNDWRDVSQSEGSLPRRLDRISSSPMSAIWVPYDLATGSSSARLEDHKSASSPQNYRTQQRYFGSTINLNGSSPSSAQQDTGSFLSKTQRVGSQSDSSVTKPGQQLTMVNLQPLDVRATRLARVMSNTTLNRQHQPLNQDHSLVNFQEGKVENLFSDQQQLQQLPETVVDQDTPTEGNLVDDDRVDQNEDDPLISDQNKVQTTSGRPTDYFSAYKQQANIVESYGKSARPIAMSGFKKRQHEGTVDSNSSDEMGAMWAK